MRSWMVVDVSLLRFEGVAKNIIHTPTYPTEHTSDFIKEVLVMATMITSKNATHAWRCWICCLAIITRPVVQPFSAVADGISRSRFSHYLRSLPPTLETLVQDTLDSDRKIVVVTGGVRSGIGKGVTASSIGVVSVLKYFGMFSLLYHTFHYFSYNTYNAVF